MLTRFLKKLLIASERALDMSDKNFDICFYDSAMEMQVIREEKIKRELAKIAEDETNKAVCSCCISQSSISNQIRFLRLKL